MNSLSPPGETRIISPGRQPPEDSSPNKRRKITPSPESSASRNFLVISTLSSVQLQPLSLPPDFFASLPTAFFSGGTPIVELRRPLQSTQHGHPTREPQLPSTSLAILPTSRRIIMPFDLCQNPPKFFEPGNRKLLLDVFPGTMRVEYDDRVLVYRFDQLPAKPWPKMIAGVPCYLTDGPRDEGPTIPIRYVPYSRIKISENLDLRDNEVAADLVFDLVRDFFAKTDITITEIQFWGHLIIIVLEDEANKSEILGAAPRSVAHCNCFYVFESMMGRPNKLSSLRHKSAS